jgi:hypothetical protein
MSQIGGIGNFPLLNSPTPSNQAPSSITQDQVQAPYLTYECDTTYAFDNGILTLPMSGVTGASTTQTTSQLPAQESSTPAYPTGTYEDRQPCVIIQVHEPIAKKIVTFSCTRIGVPPVAPSPVSTDPNDVLESAVVKAMAPKVGQDGVTRIYGLTGVYTYRLLQPPFPTTDNLEGGATPIDANTTDQNQVQPAQFQPGIAQGDIPANPAPVVPQPAGGSLLDGIPISL